MQANQFDFDIKINMGYREGVGKEKKSNWGGPREGAGKRRVRPGNNRHMISISDRAERLLVDEVSRTGRTISEIADGAILLALKP